MIYLICNQGTGARWMSSREIPHTADIRVLSHPHHVHGLHPRHPHDRVIEVGFGGNRGIRSAIERDFPSEWIEWQPMLPADSPKAAQVVFRQFSEIGESLTEVFDKALTKVNVLEAVLGQIKKEEQGRAK